MGSKLILKGEVKRSYSINVEPEPIFEYLSDMHILLTRVPNVTKVQLRKTSGRARVFFTMNVLSTSIDIFMDIEPVIDRENRIITLNTPVEPLGVKPMGYMTGNFNAIIKISPKEEGQTRISSQVALAFDASQMEMLSYFSRDMIQSTGQTLLQEYVDRMSLSYMNKLAEDFPVWHRERK